MQFQKSKGCRDDDLYHIFLQFLILALQEPGRSWRMALGYCRLQLLVDLITPAIADSKYTVARAG